MFHKITFSYPKNTISVEWSDPVYKGEGVVPQWYF
jgi:hypothetical protein